MQFLRQYRSAADQNPVGVWFEANGKLAYLFDESNRADYLVGLAQVLDRGALSWTEQFTALSEIDPFAQVWELVDADSPILALEPVAA